MILFPEIALDISHRIWYYKLKIYGKEAGDTVSFIESILYGLVSGLAEFLPISSLGHQSLMLQLFGLSHREPLRDLWVHIAILLSLFAGCKTMFSNIRREQELLSSPRRRRTGDRRGTHELRLFKGAVIPLLIGLMFYLYTKRIEFVQIKLSILFILNGIFVITPEYIRQGNKDARFMTGLDAAIMGISGALSALPGISRVATVNFYAMLRGVSRNNALNWVFLLCAPALGLFIVFDIVNLFILPLGTITFLSIVYYLVSAFAAYLGGYLGIRIMRYLSVNTGYSVFAYYSWGAAMLLFALYLIA